VLEVSEVGNKVSKSDYKAAVPELRLGLINAQYDLRKADFPVIIWIAGDDTTQEEDERPQLWRLWRSLPPKGRSAIFVGGLMRAASLRAADEITEPAFSKWLRHVSLMQQELVADGALVLKFFLHTPEKKQRKKLKETQKNPENGWYVDQRDWSALERMGPVLPIAERILRETSGPGAPWTIVESTDERYRDLTVGRTILAALSARLQQKPTAGPSLAESVFGDFDSAANVLSGVDLTKALDKKTYRKLLAEEQGKLHKLSIEARKRGVSTVLAFEGWDAGGKGGAIRRLTQSMEAGDYTVIPVAAPTQEENKYQYLWRFWRDLPGAGKCVIFDRTWYGRVLVERVEGFASLSEWQRAVAKFWLHISPEEQLARFQAREETPYKKHKITEEDYRNREQWDEYVKAIDQMVLRTTTDRARWHVIPANDKYYARIATLKAVNKGLGRRLRELDD
jgi:polyphosphate:AMP phosphotransferase